jgi:hypothetical protein
MSGRLPGAEPNVNADLKSELHGSIVDHEKKRATHTLLQTKAILNLLIFRAN